MAHRNGTGSAPCELGVSVKDENLLVEVHHDLVEGDVFTVQNW